MHRLGNVTILGALGLTLALAAGDGSVAARQDRPAGGHAHGMGLGMGPGAGPACGDATLRCATTATPFFADDASLWLAWAGGGQISVARSTDRGRSFRAAVRVSPEGMKPDGGADARPQIVADTRGAVVVAYSVVGSDRFVGRVLVAASADGGATFDTPRAICGNQASQRFAALARDPDGAIFAAWIDKRNLAAAQKAGRPFAGASLAFAWSTDGGRSFEPSRIALDEICECCRLAVAFAGPGEPAVLFRNIFDGERDHALTVFAGASEPGPVHRVGVDRWKIEACPHHGPSLAIGGDGTYHAAWFTGSDLRPGVFYARSVDRGRTFPAPMPVGDPSRNPTRPYVLAVRDTVWLVWKEYARGRSTVVLIASGDGGRTWSAPRVAAETTGFSDHPLLVTDGRQGYLSWLTHEHGYLLLPLGGGGEGPAGRP
jgi:hypothetical protein